MPDKAEANDRDLGFGLGVLVLASLLAAGAGGAADLDLAYTPIPLPGAPAQLIPVEIDGDAGPELAVVVVYTAWDEIAIEESSEIDEVDGLVAMMTVVPALLERRELWIFDRRGDGSWGALTEPLELAADVLTLEATVHPRVPLLALTDEGADAVRWITVGDTRRLAREPIVSSPTAIAGSGAFLPRLRWVHDLDGDPWPDLLLPTGGGWHLYRGLAGGFASEPDWRLATPAFEDSETPWRRDIPLPEVRDVDADGLADVIVPHPTEGWTTFFVFRNRGDGAFGEAIGPLGQSQTVHSQPESPQPTSSQSSADGESSESRVVFFDDLDGDGKAEYVSQEEIELDDDVGMRKEMAHAKRPPHRYRIFDAGAGLGAGAEPRQQFVTDGYSFPGASDVRLPGGLWDLDGDGRRDLVTLTLEFSILQAVRILVAKSLNIGLDFHVLCQQADGSFELVPDLDLSGRFRLNLNDFRQGQLSMFGGDFDGDGRKDFVQIGRGREVTIHRGADGCRFPASPDLEIRLADEPKNLALVDVMELDGDGLSDLVVVQPEDRDGDVETPPVRLDLYLSGGRP